MIIKQVAHTVIGATLLLIGVVLLVLPGPGLILVVAGLAMLARAFPGLERHIAPLRARAVRAAEDSASSRWRVAGMIIVGVLLIAAGLVWSLVPSLPFGGWPTGSSVILSGLILFALLIHSHRQVGGRGNPR